MRRPSLHPRHPYYNLETTHYVIRVGGEFTVDYPLPEDYPQTTPMAIAAFFHFLKCCQDDNGIKTIPNFTIQLVQRKVGTRRSSGRMRFYQQELLRWCHDNDEIIVM